MAPAGTKRPTPLQRLIRWVVAGTVAIACLLGLALAQLVRAQGWVNHTHQVASALAGVWAATAQAESDSRAFVLTGNPEAESLGRASQQVEAQLGALIALTADNPAQQQRALRLRDLVRRKLAFQSQVDSIRRNEGYEAADAVVMAGEGLQLMRQIESLAGEMQQAEDALLKVRTRRARAVTAVASGAGVLLMVLLVGGGVVSGNHLQREAVRREHAEAAIRESEQRFRLLVDQVQDYAIFMLDPEGRVATWNTGAERNKGYKAEEIIGKHFSVFYRPEEAAAGRPARELETAAREGRAQDEGWRVRKDGSLFWAFVSLTAIKDEDGKLIGFAKVTRDLTAVRNASLQQEALIAALRRSNQELQEFAMVASHDLQEPLRKVQMFTDRLQADYASLLPPQGQDYLRRMRSAAERGQSLILGLLSYSRVTTKAQPFARVDLAQVAREVVSDLEARLNQVGGKVELGPLPTLEADPLQMRQLLQNLIGNALKFHKPDVPPVIRVAATRPHASNEPPLGAVAPTAWELTVSDNGIGFDEKYSDRIFKLFQRLHDRGAYEGAGMGLAIVKKIVERHGGSIEAHSTPGVGATFVIRLPERQPSMEVAA